jgi:hypothetical protein
MVSLPKHPQLGFGLSPTTPGFSFFISPDGTGLILEENNGRFPTKSSLNQ